LARVLAAKGDEQGALAILEAGSVAYPVAYSSALGDIHLAAGREAQALRAYKTAQQAGLELGTPPGLLDAKITSLETRLAGTENAS
jgi:predicted negative regulator of RcsB-dependent stress response